MIINHNLSSINALNAISKTDSAMGKSLEKLSSGLRINRAADDAAGLAISEKMRAQINGLDQAKRNSMDGVSMLQTAEGGLNETHAMLQRMRELAVQASNGTLSTTDQSNINEEAKQLASEIDNIANNTKFNGNNLLNSTGTIKIQIGVGATDQLSIGLTDATAHTLGIDGNQATPDINLSSALGAQNAIAKIDTAIDTVSTARAKFGAFQNRLEHTMNNLSTTSENLQGAESRIRDTDMAAEMANFTKNQVLVQAGVSMAAQANQKSQSVLKLLG